jgi:hypothetical protein
LARDGAFNTLDITFGPDEIELSVLEREIVHGGVDGPDPSTQSRPICPCRDGVEERLVIVDRGDRAGGKIGEVPV